MDILESSPLLMKREDPRPLRLGYPMITNFYLFVLLVEFEQTKGSYVNFVGAKGGYIIGTGNVTNGKITLENVNYVEQLKHNLMSVSQIYDKKHSVHFTDSKALVLKSGFEIPEE